MFKNQKSLFYTWQTFTNYLLFNTIKYSIKLLLYNSLWFKTIDKANSKFDLKIKEALHINWRKPNLNAQQNHLPLTLSL